MFSHSTMLTNECGARLVRRALLLAVVAAGVRGDAMAQPAYAAYPGAPSSAPGNSVRPMAVGERATYELRLAGREVGSGSLAVVGEERIAGRNTLHTVLQVSGGVLLARVEERFESWIDPDRLFSRRFVQDQKELMRTRYRAYDFAVEQKTYRERGGETGVLSSHEPLDDVSFLFYARTLPLRVGDVDTIPRYFKPGHDVILRVLRKERVTVPAGTFETIVVQPTITNVGGLFGKGGQAEVYFSDDRARTVVMLKSKVPLIGSLSLHLREFRQGR